MASRSLSCVLDLPAARASSLWQPLPQHSKEDSFVYSNLFYSILFYFILSCSSGPPSHNCCWCGALNVNQCYSRGGMWLWAPRALPKFSIFANTIKYNSMRTFHVEHLLLA